MKKFSFLFLSLALFGQIASAIPADPRPFKYTQPDGTVITLRLMGDEFDHWTVDENTGNEVVLDGDGYYRPVSGVYRSARLAPAQVNNLRSRAAEFRSYNAHRDLTHGERKIPVILMQFSDLEFTLDNPVQQFTDLLNKKGYSANGGTGSVQDYYRDNSHGKFVPVFDVLPVVTLSKSYKYYGQDGYDTDVHVGEAIVEAIQLSDPLADFSQYDSDGDGYVDMLMVYYAGHNQAEHAPDYTIWPHQSGVSTDEQFDGVYFGTYFCTSEYKGSAGTRMCGIGTSSHEFGHSLGLPDFYDTDYGKNGSAHAMDEFSIMCSGSYNNEGRTPPYFTSEERKILGWMDEQIEIYGSGPLTIESIDNNVAYYTTTDVEGEYFVYEARLDNGWDEALSEYGLLVYHVDKSTAHSVAGMACKYHWDYWQYRNDLNAYGSHPMCYVIPAGSQSNLDYYGYDWLFGNIEKTYVPKSWSGDDTRYSFYDITINADNVSMNVVDLLHDGQDEGLAKLGYNSIADPGKGNYSAGDKFELKLNASRRYLPSSTKWYLDGKRVTGESITLVSGNHTIKAELTISSGTNEIVELEINVN